MHPETAKALTAQRHDELVRGSAWARHPGRRRRPRWHVSWTRTVLASAAPLPAGSGAPDRGGRPGSSLVIIVSAYRSP